MFVKQLSVFVENKQGALSDVVALLSENGINMRAISIADTQDFGGLWPWNWPINPEPCRRC